MARQRRAKLKDFDDALQPCLLAIFLYLSFILESEEDTPFLCVFREERERSRDSKAD